MTDALSQQQIAEYIEAFDIFDVEGEGRLPLDKVPCVLNALGLCPLEYNIATLQRTKREEGEDVIDCLEFLQLMSSSQTLAAAHEESTRARYAALEDALAFMDPGDTGVIQASDLKRVMKDMMKGQDLDALLLVADKGETGKVYYKELTGILLQGA